MAAQPGRPSLFVAEEYPLDVAIVALAVVAVASAGMAWKARARRRAASLRISGGRKSLVNNLFDRA